MMLVIPSHIFGTTGSLLRANWRMTREFANKAHEHLVHTLEQRQSIDYTLGQVNLLLTQLSMQPPHILLAVRRFWVWLTSKRRWKLSRLHLSGSSSTLS